MSPALALPFATLPLPVESSDSALLAWVLGFSGVTCFTLAVFLRDSLWHSVHARVLEGAVNDAQRRRLERLLARGERLAAAATLLVWLLGLATALAFAWAFAGGHAPGPLELAVAALLGAPILAAIGEVLSPTVAAAHGDSLLVRWLPTAGWLLAPLLPLAALLVRLEGLVRDMLDLPRAEPMRRIVEGLRDAIEDSELEGDLGPTEREIIENAVQFGDVDAAAIMTPRTEIEAVERCANLREALTLAARVGHGRIPVYDETLDSIVGTFSVRDCLAAVASDDVDSTDLGAIMRPAIFVPETKLVSELLSDFRAQRLELAIVLDEYGGTAGLITMSDILEELIGELPDEFSPKEPDPIRKLDDGNFEIDASERVSEVNEELELELPEEGDYETVAGFVLAELGHFPKVGERFVFGRNEVQVTRASDRRVLEVRVVRLPARAAQ